MTTTETRGRTMIQKHVGSGGRATACLAAAASLYAQPSEAFSLFPSSRCIAPSCCNYHHNGYYPSKRIGRKRNRPTTATGTTPSLSLFTTSPSTSDADIGESIKKSASSSSDDLDDDDDDHHQQQEEEETTSSFGWTAGNVYNDLDVLRREIVQSKADQQLRRLDDRERLDWFAANRRPLHCDVRRFVLTPLVVSLLLTTVLSHCGSNFITPSRLFTVFFDIHFVSIVLVAPMLLLLAKRMSSRPRPVQPSEQLQVLNREYRQSFQQQGSKTTSSTCHDCVLCLLENWTSAVVGPSILLACLYYMFLPPLFRKGFPSAAVGGIQIGASTATAAAAAVGAVQLITRVGVIAALYQYPSLLYQLQRQHQPRPLDRHVMRLQQAASLALSLAPLGIASDMSKIMRSLPPRLVSSLVCFGLLPYVKHRLVRGIRVRPLTRRSARFRSIVGTLLTLTQLTAVWDLGRVVLQTWWRTFTLPPTLSYKSLVIAAICVSLLLAVPIGHLIAVCKLFRVSYTHDISLGNDEDTFNAIVHNPEERKERFKWRYRLEWREPERIMDTLSKWKGGLSYWLLFEGSVEDQLRRDFQTNQKSAAYKRGLTVLQRMEQEMKDNPGAPKTIDRSQWKSKAMEQVAAKHDKDYNSGTFEDPLGVAVQQTFGIGLNYQFDHWSELEEGERPSVRRLQARAAKSAIKRVQDLYDAEALREELKSIHDTGERELKKAEARRATEAEIAYLASALSDLIPTEPSQDAASQPTRIQQYRRSYKRASSHEMIVDSPGLESLLDSKPDDQDQTDEEFVDAWMRRLHNEDEDDSTVLV